MHFSVVFVLSLLTVPCAFCATEECIEFVSRLSDTCEAFEYASDRVIDLEIDTAEVRAQDEREEDSALSRAFNRISNASFDAECCSLMTSINESRCFCQPDIVDAFQSDISDELLAFTLFSTGRSQPDGCDGAIWASFDEDECLLLGPGPDIEPDRDCRTFRDELRDRRLLNGRFNLLEEALDVTGVLDEITSLAQFVIFAPSDSAFRRFAREQDLSIAELLDDVEFLTTVLRRHIITGDDIRRLSRNRGEVRTLQGSTITIGRSDSGNLTVQDLDLLQEDVQVCRGSVNVIGGVLWPLSSSNRRARVIEDDSDSLEEDCRSIYETLVSSEEAFGVLLDQISLVPEVEERLEGSGPITLFAFASNEVQMERLMSSEDSIDEIRDSLERLIVNEDLASSVFVANQTLKSISNETLRITIDRDVISINGVALTQVDLIACNGRIHVSSEPIPLDNSIPQEAPVRQESEDPQDACACAEDGVSNGVNTGRLGCGQHVIEEDDNQLFCYVKSPENCTERGEDQITVSRRFPSAYWRTCDLNEANLPDLNEAIQDLDFLEHIYKYFIFSRLQQNLTSKDPPLTLLVPSDEAITQFSLENLLEEGTNGEESIRKLLRGHIIEGNFNVDDLQSLDNITTLDGTVLTLRQDTDDNLVIDNLARVIRSDILCSNGVVHVIDHVIRPESILRTGSVDSCACIEEDEDLPSDRLGCGKHIPDRGAFCYVQDPENCIIGQESESFPGQKWRTCVDPCRCSRTGLSGRVSTGLRGCEVHFPRSDPFCYVAEPRRCKTARNSEVYRGAGWKYCGSQSTSRIPRSTSDPCDCSPDGYSGDVYTGRAGCGRFNDPFAVLEICYVNEPGECWFSIPSVRYNGAEWRFC